MMIAPRSDGTIRELDLADMAMVAGGADSGGQTWTCTVTIKPDVTETRCTGPNGEKIVRWDYPQPLQL